MSDVAYLLLATGGFLFVIIAVAVLFYVFNALALFTMAKNKGIQHAWFAWIPVVANFLMGEILDDTVCFAGKKIPYASWFLCLGGLGVSIVSAILGLIPFLGAFLSAVLTVALVVYVYAAYYRLFKLYKPENAVLFLVLSIFFSFLMPIFLFAVRKNAPQEYI